MISPIKISTTTRPGDLVPFIYIHSQSVSMNVGQALTRIGQVESFHQMMTERDKFTLCVNKIDLKKLPEGTDVNQFVKKDSIVELVNLGKEEESKSDSSRAVSIEGLIKDALKVQKQQGLNPAEDQLMRDASSIDPLISGNSIAKKKNSMQRQLGFTNFVQMFERQANNATGYLEVENLPAKQDLSLFESEFSQKQ